MATSGIPPPNGSLPGGVEADRLLQRLLEGLGMESSSAMSLDVFASSTAQRPSFAVAAPKKWWARSAFEDLCPPGVWVDLAAALLQPALRRPGATGTGADGNSQRRRRPHPSGSVGFRPGESGDARWHCLLAARSASSVQARGEAGPCPESQLFQNGSRPVPLAELAGTAAHELNQPLTSIMGYADLLRRHVTDDNPDAATIDIILREAERMADIVRKIGRVNRTRIRPMSEILESSTWSERARLREERGRMIAEAVIFRRSRSRAAKRGVDPKRTVRKPSELRESLRPGRSVGTCDRGRRGPRRAGHAVRRLPRLPCAVRSRSSHEAAN